MAVKRCRGSAEKGTLRQVVSVRMGGCAAQAWRAASPQLRAALTARLEKAALASIPKTTQEKVHPVRPYFLRGAFFLG